MRRAVALGLLLCSPAVAHAGMPMVALDEVAAMRLESISFFLVVILLAAWALRLLWNRLARDIERLPRLGYRACLAAVLLWGFCFVLVLSMIAGARELMTPGAWVKDGATYSLAAEEPLDIARRQRLEMLREQLWRYAQAHDGALPPHDLDPEIPAGAWQTIDSAGLRYIYVGGLRRDEGRVPVAYEPGAFGPQRFVLFADGSIARMHQDEVRGSLQDLR